jgi:glycerol-3-phosphate dehydrogenase subunit C
MVPDTKVNTIERCSGHAGTWGVKKEFHETALKIGRPVFRQMAEHPGGEPDWIASDCQLGRTPHRTGHGDRGQADRRQAGPPDHPSADRLRFEGVNPMMAKVTRDSLMTLEAYAKARPDFRKKVIGHKKHRAVRLGEHITLLFEDELTVRYQIQEMLRIEKIFEEDGITHELESYNPLVPDGRNFKATMLIEYEDADVRRDRAGLADRRRGPRLGAGRRIAARLCDRRRGPRARERRDKTSAVHFLRFELTDEMDSAVASWVCYDVIHAFRETLNDNPDNAH